MSTPNYLFISNKLEFLLHCEYYKESRIQNQLLILAKERGRSKSRHEKRDQQDWNHLNIAAQTQAWGICT